MAARAAEVLVDTADWSAVFVARGLLVEFSHSRYLDETMNKAQIWKLSALRESTILISMGITTRVSLVPPWSHSCLNLQASSASRAAKAAASHKVATSGSYSCFAFWFASGSRGGVVL